MADPLASFWDDVAPDAVADKLADAVIHRARQTAFLVGAGVSIGSGLPSFRDFEQSVLKLLVGDALDDKQTKDVMNRLRPEVLIQALWQTYGDDVFQVYRMLEGGVPNPNHFLLAEALKRGACVVTTNVDTLIEDACKRLRFKPVVFCEPKKLPKERLNGCLIKVHGTIDRNKRGFGRYSSIRMALDHVGRGIDDVTAGVMRRAVANRDLIVAGYSGNDHFSVQPFLVREPSDQAVVWFMFSPSTAPPIVSKGKSRFRERRNKMFEAAYKGGIIPMSRTTGSRRKPSWEEISTCEILQNREHSVLIDCNSSAVLKTALATVCRGPGRLKGRSPNLPSTAPLSGVPLQPTSAERYEVAARLLVIMSKTKRARRIIALAQRLPNSKPTVLANLSSTCDTIDRPAVKKDKLAHARQEFEHLAAGGKRFEAIERGLAVANGYRIARQFETALELLAHVEELLNHKNFKERIRGYDRSRLRASLLLYRGLAHGLGGRQTLDAKIYGLSCLDKAFAAATVAGDVARSAAVLNGRGLVLAQLAEQVESILQAAEDSLDEAFGLYARLQDARYMFQPLRNQLIVHQLRSRACADSEHGYWMERARSRYETASKYLVRVEREGEIGLDRAEIELRAAQIAVDMRQMDVARDHLDQALLLAEQLEDDLRQVRALSLMLELPGVAARDVSMRCLELIRSYLDRKKTDLMQDAIQSRSLLDSTYRIGHDYPNRRGLAIEILQRLETIMDEAGMRLVRDSAIRHRRALEAGPAAPRRFRKRASRARTARR
jgi:hypothetical protein